MYRTESEFKDHPRITWFGHGGTVAYVDYKGATESYFIGGDGNGHFKVIPPSAAADNRERHGFDHIDDGIQYALDQASR